MVCACVFALSFVPICKTRLKHAQLLVALAAREPKLHIELRRVLQDLAVRRSFTLARRRGLLLGAAQVFVGV